MAKEKSAKVKDKEEKQGELPAGTPAKKKNQKSYALTAAAGTLLILILALALFFAADLLFPFRRGMGVGPGFMGFDSSFMGDYFAFKTMVSMMITLLSLFLTFVYLKDYLELRSELTLAILAAVISFMLFGLSTNPMLFVMFGLPPARPGIFEVIPLIFAAVSLGLLAWVSNK